MKRQVAKIIHKGTYKVIFNDQTDCNPYTIFKVTDGHTKKLVAYQDMESCLYYLCALAYRRSSDSKGGKDKDEE